LLPIRDLPLLGIKTTTSFHSSFHPKFIVPPSRVSPQLFLVPLAGAMDGLQVEYS
jgi:hypothetical protein